MDSGALTLQRIHPRTTILRATKALSSQPRPQCMLFSKFQRRSRAKCQTFSSQRCIAMAAKRGGSGTDESKKKGFGAETNPKANTKQTAVKKPFANDAKSLDLRDEVDGSTPGGSNDVEFDERLRAVKKAAEEKKKELSRQKFAPIDYDAQATPSSTSSFTGSWTENLGAKIAIGGFGVIFAAIFAFGDILPSGSPTPSSSSPASPSAQALSEEQRNALQKQADDFEATLKLQPDDRDALEGAAVTFSQLGQFQKASQLLEKLSKGAPNDGEVWRLLGEVRSAMGEFDKSAEAFRAAIRVLPSENIDILSELTGALIDAGKPADAVGEILSARQRVKLASEAAGGGGRGVDPVQVELLLGKAYAAWGKPGDAVAVFDALIASEPDDFRPYLAKGLVLKDQGSVGDAERMFVQARFLAPERARPIVDQISGRTRP